MCDPVSMMIGSMAVSAVGTGFSAYSQIQAGQVQQAAYAQQAKLQQEKANYDMALITNKYEKVAGEQRTIAAGSGFSSSSFADLFADSAMDAALQKKAVQYGADAASDQLLFQGEVAKSNAQMGAIGTVIGGIGNSLSMGAKVAGASSNATSITPQWSTTVSYAG